MHRRCESASLGWALRLCAGVVGCCGVLLHGCLCYFLLLSTAAARHACMAMKGSRASCSPLHNTLYVCSCVARSVCFGGLQRLACAGGGDGLLSHELVRQVQRQSAGTESLSVTLMSHNRSNGVAQQACTTHDRSVVSAAAVTGARVQ